MPLSGEIIRASDPIPGQRIGVTENTADSATFTAETVIMTLTVELDLGRTYSVFANPGLFSSSANTVVRVQLREDSISGTVIDATVDDVVSNTGSGTRKHALVLLSDYVATATGNKTFVVTGELATGAGTAQMEGSSNRKSYLLVRYESG